MSKRKKVEDEFIKGLLLLIIVIPISFFLGIYKMTLFFILVVVIIFIVVALQRKQKYNYFDNKKNLQEIRNFTPSEFEEFIAILFERRGYKSEKVGGSYDGGIDIIVEKDGRKHYIQCKKFITRKVTIYDVRDFYGAIIDKLAGGKGIFITTNIFTLEAEKFCEDKPIELIDGQKLMSYLNKTEDIKVRVKILECPKCRVRYF